MAEQLDGLGEIPVISVSAASTRLPTEWPLKCPPFVKRYCRTRDSGELCDASAARQLRASPGGRMPNSRRIQPELPPSSVTGRSR